MAANVLKVVGFTLAAALFSLFFVTGAIGRAIAWVTLWCADKPAWFWVLVLAVAALILWAYDSKHPR